MLRKCMVALSMISGLCFGGAALAQASATILGLRDSGNTFYAAANSGTLRLNSDPLDSTAVLAGSERLEVWALGAPYAGNPIRGNMLLRWNGSRGGANTPALPFGALPDGNYYLAVIAYSQTTDIQLMPVGGTTPKACMAKYNDLNNWTSGDTQYCAFDVAGFDNFAGSLRCSSGKCVTSASSPQDMVPETGWWWNPSESGRGIMLEVSNDWVFASFQLYDNSGAATWYVASAPLASGGTVSAQLAQFGAGQTLTGPYVAPVTVNPNVGTISIQFSGSANGVLTLPDGRQVPIERFRF